jgi:hypothetical protein
LRRARPGGYIAPMKIGSRPLIGCVRLAPLAETNREGLRAAAFGAASV